MRAPLAAKSQARRCPAARISLFLLVLGAPLLGCTGGSGGSSGTSGSSSSSTTPPSCEIAVAWGTRKDGAFVAFNEGDDAPVTLGFQGFRFIDGTIRVSGGDAAEARVRFDSLVQDQAPVTQEAGVFALLAGADGAQYADSIQLFFNDIPMPQLLGHTCQTKVTTTIGACKVSTTVGVVLTLGECQSPPDDAGVIDTGPCDAGAP